jgi:nucleoside-diphosphate-sugar epimerase
VKVFVTGGTGCLGRQLIEVLLAHDCDVTALVRTFDRTRSLPEAVRTVAGDVTRRNSLKAGMRGAEVVFHAAAWTKLGTRPRDYALMQRITVEGTREVLELAADLGGPRVVFTSGLEIYGDTGGQVLDEAHLPAAPVLASEYARSKRQALLEVVQPMQARGLPVVVVCPGALYGPDDASLRGRLWCRYAQHRLPVMVGPATAYCWTHAADAAAGVWMAATEGRPGETYILAGPALSQREFFSAAERATGLPAPRLWLPAGWAGVPATWLRRARPALAEVLRSFSGLTYLARSDKAHSELGWQARSVEVGLARTKSPNGISPARSAGDIPLGDY